MRAITKDAVNAFINAKAFNRSNTRVEVLPNVTIMYLFNNAIAYLYNDVSKELLIDTCGYKTATTKERINGIFEALKIGYIHQKNKVWYLKNLLTYGYYYAELKTRTVTFNQCVKNDLVYYKVEPLYQTNIK